jgi:hypothetical protein
MNPRLLPRLAILHDVAFPRWLGWAAAASGGLLLAFLSSLPEQGLLVRNDRPTWLACACALGFVACMTASPAPPCAGVFAVALALDARHRRSAMRAFGGGRGRGHRSVRRHPCLSSVLFLLRTALVGLAPLRRPLRKVVA